MSAKGATPWGADQDDIIYVPLTTGTLRLFGQRYVKTITVQAEDVAKIDATQQEVRDLLIARHKTEDFQIRNMASIIATATETQNRSEEHTSELQSLMRISYAVLCLKKKKNININNQYYNT